MQSTDKTTIELAGRKFDIPCLPFAKNRVIVPACSFALKAMGKMTGPEKEPLSITAIDYMYLAVFEAVNYVNPKIDRKEYDSWNIYTPELVTAVTKISIQTGVLMRMPDQSIKDQNAGEQ